MACAVVISGCSAKDPITTTPVYHNGTPTNRRTLNSWELTMRSNADGSSNATSKPIVLPKSVATSSAEYDLRSPLALSAYSAISAVGSVPTKFVSVRALNGTLLLSGTVFSKAQVTTAGEIAAKTPGVTKVINTLRIRPGQAEQ